MASARKCRRLRGDHLSARRVPVREHDPIFAGEGGAEFDEGESAEPRSAHHPGGHVYALPVATMTISGRPAAAEWLGVVHGSGQVLAEGVSSCSRILFELSGHRALSGTCLRNFPNTSIVTLTAVSAVAN